MRLGPIAISMALATTVACGGTGDPEPTAGEVTGSVLVFAAASLTDAFGEIEAAFEGAHPGADVQLNLAGSSSLREQILAGAPADVFASANPETMQAVVDGGEVDGGPEVFARNRLQIAVPAGNPGGVVGLADLADDDLLVGLCAEGVPCGDLARRALAQAGVEPSLDTNEPDVRALLTKIAADELDAGIVYVTDVAAAGQEVQGIDLPTEVDVVAAYPMAVLAGSPNPVGARALVEFVRSPDGQAILADYGFSSP